MGLCTAPVRQGRLTFLCKSYKYHTYPRRKWITRVTVLVLVENQSSWHVDYNGSNTVLSIERRKQTQSRTRQISVEVEAEAQAWVHGLATQMYKLNSPSISYTRALTVRAPTRLFQSNKMIKISDGMLSSDACLAINMPTCQLFCARNQALIIVIFYKQLASRQRTVARHRPTVGRNN